MNPRLQFHLPPRACLFALLVILAVTTAGCLAETGAEPTGTDTSVTETSDDSTSDGSGTCATFVFGGYSGTPTANANWDYIQANIFAGSGGCTNCHNVASGGAGPSGLSLDGDQYSADVTDHLESGYSSVDLAIIEPGSRECSFLYVKISTADDVLTASSQGSRMPLNSTPLGSADIELIGTWIDEGAVESASN